MLDVHPPHEAAHGWRDILIHLATITIGLVIALSLEGCVEWQHHRHLVREARENIRSEITDNRKEVEGAIDTIHKEQAEMKQDVAALVVLRKDLRTQGLRVTLAFSTVSLPSASWNTARDTGALGYMDYPEVKSYAQLYDLQTLFANQTVRVTGAYTRSFSLMSAFDADVKASNAIQKQDVDAALQNVLAVQAELLVYEATAKELDKNYAEVLQKQH